MFLRVLNLNITIKYVADNILYMVLYMKLKTKQHLRKVTYNQPDESSFGDRFVTNEDIPYVCKLYAIHYTLLVVDTALDLWLVPLGWMRSLIYLTRQYVFKAYTITSSNYSQQIVATLLLILIRWLLPSSITHGHFEVCVFDVLNKGNVCPNSENTKRRLASFQKTFSDSFHINYHVLIMLGKES